MKRTLLAAVACTGLACAEEPAPAPAPAGNAPEIVDRAPMPNRPAEVTDVEPAAPAAPGRLPSLANTVIRLEDEIARITGRMDELLAARRAAGYEATLEGWDVAQLRAEQRERVARQRQRVLLSEQITQCLDYDGRAALAEARMVVWDRDTDLAALERDRRSADADVATLRWWIAARTAKQAQLAQARKDLAAIAAARDKRPAFVPPKP